MYINLAVFSFVTWPFHSNERQVNPIDGFVSASLQYSLVLRVDVSIPVLCIRFVTHYVPQTASEIALRYFVQFIAQSTSLTRNS